MTTRDLRGNLQPSVSTVAFSTPATGSADVTPPLISALTVSNTTSTGTRLNVSSNEPGTGYYVVLPSGSVAPSVAQIRAGQNAS